MKIFFEGYTHSPIPFASEYIKALRELGHEVFEIDLREACNITKGYAYRDLMNDLKFPQFKEKLENNWTGILTRIKQEKPDLFLVETGKLFSIDILKKITELVPTVMIAFDACYDWLGHFVAPYYSCVITYIDYDKYKTLNPNTIYYNPHAVFSYHSKMDETKSIDVALIGSAYMNRKIIVDELRRIYKIYPICFGVGWDTNEFIIPYHNLLKKIINRSKICIDIRLSPNLPGMGLRFFETIGCGTLLLTDYKPKDMRYGYVYCENTKAFANAIKYYLADEQTREHEAELGYVEIHQKFSTKMVMQEMIKQIGEVLKL